MRLPVRVGDKVLFRVLAGMIFRFAVMPSLLTLLLVAPITATASNLIARAVETFCAPQPTLPSVNTCSTCHSTTNNRGLNDLTVNGQWAITSATYSQFCPAVNSSGSDTSSQTSSSSSSAFSSASRSSGIGGMSTATSGSRGIGMGRGGSLIGEDQSAPPSGSSSRRSSISLGTGLQRLLGLIEQP